MLRDHTSATLGRAAGALATFCVLAGVAVEARAGTYEDELVGPRALAMGGAHVAIANDNGAMFFNPAGISWGAKYSIELGYAYSFDLHSHSPFLSIVDSKSSKVGGGLEVSYLNSRITDAGTGEEMVRNGYDVRFALSYPLTDRIFFGVMNKLVTRRLDPRGVMEPKNDDLGPDDYKKYAVDAGLLVAFSDSISFGLTGRNLTLPREPDMPTDVRAGIGVGVGGIVLGTVDYVMDFTTANRVTHSVHAGAEVFLFGALALRAGYELNGAEPDGAGGFGWGHWVSGGAAYVSESFALDAGYKRRVAGPAPSTPGTKTDGDTFAVTLRFFL